MGEMNQKAKNKNISQKTPLSLDIDEIQKYREIQFLHHSNLLRLQIEEMMSTLEIRNKTKVKLQFWMNEITDFLKKLPKSKQFQLSDLKWLQENEMKLPIKELSELPSTNGLFTFVPPAEVLMVGSFALDLSSKHSKVVDVVLILPKEFMQHNDLFNGKWILRRTLYLTWLGKCLEKETNLVSSVSWTIHCGSRLRPVLQVTPVGNLGNWRVNFFPIPKEDFFKISLISPTKSNISHSWYFQQENSNCESLSTPYHNWVCSVDLIILKHQEFIKTHLIHSSWIQGLKLLKIWMKQRNLTVGEGSFSSHLMTLFIVYLAKTRKIFPQMSQYQVFRTALVHISQTDWTSEGPSLYEGIKMSDRNVVVPDIQDFHRLYPVVFVDHTGFSNVACNVSLDSYKELKFEVEISLKILELSSTSSFEALFINKAEFLLSSDQVIKISFDAETVNRICSKLEEESSNFRMDRLGEITNVVFSSVLSTLSEGLGERVDLICVSRDDLIWNFGSVLSNERRDIVLGFRLNPRQSIALLTKGPPADSQDASKFRAFWGEISSLRRFTDSTFHEAVLWMESGVPVGDRRLIVGKIVEYVMHRHFGIPSNKIQYIASQLEDVLRPKVSVSVENFKYGTGEELISSAIIAFDNLAVKLRSLDLPLKVAGIQSTSDVLKYACVFPPLSSRVPQPFIQNGSKRLKICHFQSVSKENTWTPFYRPSINVQVFLEISGKWPDDLAAINSVKYEFLVKIAELLKKDGVTCILLKKYLLLVWKGYVFNIQVCYRREIYLLKDVDNDDAEGGRKDTDASFALEKEIEILPKLTSSINSLQSKHLCFSGSVRLVRRWVSSQLLLPHFPHIVIDLLVSYLFINPYPYSAPSTPHVTLLRFMKMMSSTDWKSTPVFVNLRNELTVNDEEELTKRFTNSRSFFPHLFVCTPCELRPLSGDLEITNEDWNKRLRYASCWTRTEPSLPILGRMKVVAEAALTTFENSLWKKNFDFKVLFRPQLSDYNVLIYVEESQISRRLENFDSDQEMSFESYSHVKGELLPITDFDPVHLYLRRLRETCGKDALFFHDEHGGCVIGVLWKPQVFQEKGPKKSSVEKHKAVGTNNLKVVFDSEVIIKKYRSLGNGLVKEIKLNS